MGGLYVLEALRTPFLDAVFSAVTRLGGTAVFVALGLSVFWCVSRKRGLYLLAAGFAGALLGQLLKPVFRVPRPWVLDPNFSVVERARAAATGYSFPSGHSINAMAVYGGLARCAKRPVLRWLCVAILCLVAFSRAYLGVHTPLDVCGGLLLGALPVLALPPLFERYGENRAARRWMWLAQLALSAAATAFLTLWPWPEDIDAANLAVGVNNGWMLLGAAAGLLLTDLLLGLDFPERAPLWAQALKAALGLLLTLAVAEGLRFPLAALGLPNGLARALRCCAAVFFAAGL